VPTRLSLTKQVADTLVDLLVLSMTMLLVHDSNPTLGPALFLSTHLDLRVFPGVPPLASACPNATNPLVLNMMAKTTILPADVLIRVPPTSITFASPPRCNWRFRTTSPSFARPQSGLANTG